MLQLAQVMKRATAVHSSRIPFNIIIKMKILSLLAAYAVAKVASLDPYLRTVGVLTMPPQENDRLKGHGHYITEMADIWMRSGGLFPVYIPYNISDADLYPILDQINGVFFTGGDLDLYNETSGTPP